MEFEIEKEVFGRKVIFKCKTEKDFDFHIKVKSNIFNKEILAKWISSENIVYFNDNIYFLGKKISGFRINDEKIVNELEKEKREFFEEQKRREKEIEKQKEEEFQAFLRNENYFKNKVIISQGCDTGTFYIQNVKNEKIRDFVNNALNKYLDGLIFSEWIPDYWLPNPKAKFEIKNLIKEGKARITEDERHEEVLELDADIINEIVNLLKQEIEEKKKAEEEEIKQLMEKIRREGKVLIEQWIEDCCDPREECDADVHYIYAFSDKEEAEKFALEKKTKAYYDEKIQAWKVHVWSHTW